MAIGVIRGKQSKPKASPLIFAYKKSQKMLITLKTKIWLTILSIVLMFTFFTLYYFPKQQGKLLLKNYSNEVQNLANTVALGVKIAITEQNFEGVQTAIEFVKDDPRLKFVSMLQRDTIWNGLHTAYTVQTSVFKTFPEKEHPKASATSNDSIIVKEAPFVTSVMSGSILLAFNTKEIVASKRNIRLTSLIVSGVVLIIGIFIGFWLAKNISVPVLALSKAAKLVGQGDLSQRIKKPGKDEIGELGRAFNRMIEDLSLTRKELDESNVSLSAANDALNITLSELKSTQALDRVRAETASMRTTGDLEKITPLIWDELTTLGVPFIRCGVLIMDEEQQQIHSFLSTPDGKAIAAFQLPYDSAGELTKVLAHWRKNEIYKDHWNEATIAKWTKSLVGQGVIASEEKYLTSNHPVSLDLHFLPFLQGMLYIGSETPLSDEEIHLVQTLADAFSTAYARYEDFNKLESAKAKLEKTLVDLKLAQAQLVQSEKMASLGELTAGIAHEIQNPLNFVNNFSDINTELIDEMKNELANDNRQLAIEIADDIMENEQKINHHGKRADAIVKGMLQHSRSSTGQKEPTDINALADEYLRLSYHGLRAKDKFFNAGMQTSFDNSIGKIDIVPQDIGRVLLNLFNNAFYTVNEKRKLNIPGYEPTVMVKTSLNPPLEASGAGVSITVLDNGNGIPQTILGKIFQPFFTTKPTGKGTGLGLSLSYDIVKAHGGTLKVETKEGEGSEFVISLPK